MDHLFSSPEKAPQSNGKAKNGAARDADVTNSDEEDMDVGSSEFDRES
jgi:hypothetical protein